MTAPAPLHRENNFDFLRMVAASLVLLSHHFPITGRGEPAFFSLHSYGGIAVLIFFSISGYLVTQSWYADPNLRRFALRRILRIWPALTVAVAGAALVLGPWVSTLPAGEYFASEGVWRYFHNLHMNSVFVLPGVFEDNPLPAAVNGSLWTIPLEVRCYIVFGLLGAVGLWKKRFLLPAFAVAYAVWYLARYSPDLGHKLRYKHEFATYFFFGAALFALKDTWQKNPLRWGAALAAAGALATVLGFPYLGLSLVLPYTVIWFGTSATPFIRSAGRYGDFSYGIYLFAFPVQQTIVKYLYPDFGFAGTLCIAYAITLALAVLSWHWVEKTALRLKPRRRPSP